MTRGRVRVHRFRAVGTRGPDSLHDLYRRRQGVHAPRGLLDRASDIIAGFAGSWGFLALHVCWWAAWLILRVERFPYGLLTMVLSLEAIVLATVILMSANRQSAKDRLRDDTEADEIGVLYRVVNEQHVIQRELLDLQHQQMRILVEQNAILAALDPQSKTETRSETMGERSTDDG